MYDKFPMVYIQNQQQKTTCLQQAAEDRQQSTSAQTKTKKKVGFLIQKIKPDFFKVMFIL